MGAPGGVDVSGPTDCDAVCGPAERGLAVGWGPRKRGVNGLGKGIE